MQVRHNRIYRFVSIILIFVLTMSIMTGCSGKKNEGAKDTPVSPETSTEGNEEIQADQSDKPITALPLDTVMMTVNDKSYTLGELMYVIYYLEEEFSSTAIGYEEQHGIDFWNDIMDEATNETGTDLARKSMMETAAMLAVLLPIAEEAGYTCNAVEIQEIEWDADSILAGLNQTYLDRTGFTKDNLVEIIKKFTIVNKYVQDQTEQQKVDKDKITATINAKDEKYKQVQLEYIFLGTLVPDESNRETHIGAEETTALLKKAKTMLNQVKAGKSMENVYNQICTDSDVNIYYTEEAILDSELEKEMVRAIKSCKEGQLYDSLVETDKGYYIFRLVSNNATDAYENAVAEAISDAKSEAYEKTYEKLISAYSIVYNQENWDKLVLKKYAYPEEEDTSGMANDSEFFDLSGLTGDTEIVLPDDTAGGDDGSVG
ncbi:MAG: hypothetical protein Q4G58_12980 [bacterium]|nr:hypothetical protein [bacterium]